MEAKLIEPNRKGNGAKIDKRWIDAAGSPLGKSLAVSFLFITTFGKLLLRWLWKGVVWVFGVLLLIRLLAYVANQNSLADPVIIAHDIQPGTHIINGAFDFGYRLSLTVHNKADKRGLVKIVVHLSCSEGEWSREQLVAFEPGQTMDLDYIFQEPTINSDNVQSRYEVTLVSE
jgi:hypothetical protein